MGSFRFEDSIAWQKSQELAIIVYELFRTNKDYSFRDQIQRAVVSISNNIAEGFERSGIAETRYFLGIAKGSCGEVRSMTHLAQKLQFIKNEDAKRIISLSDEIAKLVYSFIRK